MECQSWNKMLFLLLNWDVAWNRTAEKQQERMSTPRNMTDDWGTATSLSLVMEVTNFLSMWA